MEMKMDKNKIIEESEKFMKENIPQSRDKEDYLRHISGARKYSIMLAKIYKADIFVVEVAALLHDIGADKGKRHAGESSKIARIFLLALNIPSDILDRILKCIENHSYYSSVNSIEEQIIQDADGIIFIEDTYKSFFEKLRKKYSLGDAKKLIIEKINNMRNKIKTDKGIEIAEKLLPIALNSIENQKWLCVLIILSS